jgi:hypothetical protein
MVRRRTVRRAVRLSAFAVLLSFGPAPVADAQSLAETARRTEERRKAPDESLTITKLPPTPEDPQAPPQLTTDMLRRYSRARGLLADMRRLDSQLHQRLYKRTETVRHYDDLESVLTGEPAVVELLGTYRLTPHSYTQVEVLIWRLHDYFQRPRSVPEVLTPLQQQNVEFGFEHAWLVDAVWRLGLEQEKGLRLWFNGLPRYD